MVFDCNLQKNIQNSNAQGYYIKLIVSIFTTRGNSPILTFLAG